MTPDLLTLLQSVDTPSVCNAIEVVQGKRGFSNFTRGTMLCSDPDGHPVVGFARTAKLAALVPSKEPAETVRARRMAYYRYMAEAPAPAVAVIEDEDFPDCVGAYWGEINTNVHKGFGLNGALTNGVMRDLGSLPDGFPVVAGSIGPSHAFVHVTDVDVTVNVFGMTVAPGDLVHADRHGAVVIPQDVVPGLHAGISKMQDTESIVLDEARKPGFDFAAFEKAWAEFERRRT